MEKIEFKNLPDTSTPLNATNLNQLQDNVEDAIPEVETASSTSEEDTYSCSYVNTLHTQKEIYLNGTKILWEE